jgi:heme exporter protein A
MHGRVGEALMRLIAEALTSIRGGRTLFSGLSISVDAGEALLLRGPNGAGKTTLIRIIAGFLRPAEGSVRLEQGDPERSLAEQCHYVGHLNGLKASLSVDENAAFWGAFLGGAPADVEGALTAFGLAGLRDTPTAYLSAGQKRRLGLARVLLAHRPLWLLDEPTASLDDGAQNMLAGVIEEHLARGGLVVAATHEPLALGRSWSLPLGGAGRQP